MGYIPTNYLNNFGYFIIDVADGKHKTNALEKLVKGSGDVDKVADLLEWSPHCSNKSEKSSKTCVKVNDIAS